PQVTPEKVTVLGPESILSQVDFAVADVSLASEKVTIERSYRLVPRTERGHQIEGVTLEPASADVRITIKQQLFFQTFGIMPQLKGSPASGYWVSGMTAEPQQATVFGPREVLQNLGFLKTKPVDISNTSANVTRQVEVDLPEGATMVGSRTVEARIVIAPVKGSVKVQVTPEFEGLTGGRRPSLSVSTVEVTLTGDLPILNKLNPSDVHATLNFKNLAPGPYQVDVKVTAPPGLQVVSVLPNSMGVVIPQ
ncbi:MAG: hypothetical protein HY677_02985, partial [Chloroflexi bacterium]|nr:hypothetical protein [Chloroflexota bacterium]